MAFKFAFFCVSAVLVQTITASCINANNALNNAYSINNANAFGSNNINGYGSNIALSNSNANAFSNAHNNNNAISNLAINNIANNARLGNAVGNSGFSTSFPVSSQSLVQPGTVSVQSEVAIEGPLSVIGQLPFLGAVALEGSVPTNGQGSVAYSCGNENVGIINEAVPAASSYIESGYGYAGGFGNTPIYVY